MSSLFIHQLDLIQEKSKTLTYQHSTTHPDHNIQDLIEKGLILVLPGNIFIHAMNNYQFLIQEIRTP